ncbi:hypothetical protein ACFLZB_03710, partial [Nanoarchaeota archaeon]
GINVNNNVYTPDQIRNNNLILIGTPCSNSKIAELLEISDCDSYFNNNEALIKAVDYNGNLALIVTGKTSSEVDEAAKVLADFDDESFRGDTHHIDVGSTLSSVTVQALSDSYTFTTGSGGSYTVRVEVTDSSNAVTSHQWNIEIFDKPIADTFNGDTTDFSTMSEEDLSSVNLILEKTSYGKIVFDNPVDLRDVVDLDTYVHIGQDIFALDSVQLPDLDYPATITLYGVTVTNPVIYYSSIFSTNSNDADKLCNFCTIQSYENGELTFHVDHFSSFAIKEATSPDIVLPDSIQVGSDDAEREQNVTTQFTISNPGTTDAVDSVVISSNALGKYDVQFSTGTTYTSQLTVNLNPGESKNINVRTYIPQNEDGGLHSIGQISAANDDYSDTAPLYIYPENNLDLISVKVDGDSVSDGETTDIKPDTTLEVEVEVKNIGDLDFDEVNIIATIYDLDGDDVEEETNFELKDGKKEEVTLSFEVPEDLDEDQYDLNIEIEAEDEDGVTHSHTVDITLETKKENHHLKLEPQLSIDEVSCVRNINLYLTVKNLGENDEDDVDIKVKNSDLNIDLGRNGIDIDENDKYRTTYNLDLNDAQEGTYTIDVEVYRDSKLEDQAALTLAVSACSETQTQQQDVDTKQVSEKHAELLKGYMTKTSAAVKEFSNTDIYLTLLAVMFIITIGVAIFVVGAIVIKKRRG